MYESLFDAENEKIRKLLNDAKKRELEERYGMCFSGDNPDLPPEIESRWLRHIEEFERQHECARMITVREFLGDPSFTPIEAIPPGGTEEKLEEALSLLALHDISLSFEDDVPSEEVYRFIITEFMDAEIEDIRIDGMIHGFIYEEFHPGEDRLDD